MSHYAKVNSEGIVEDVIVAEEDFIALLPQEVGVRWIQTSYNTWGGVHYEPDSQTPSQDQSKALRKNYAGIGHTYDSERDAFIPPKPFASWTLNENTCLWESPVPMPEIKGVYDWNEQTLSWDKVTLE